MIMRETQGLEIQQEIRKKQQRKNVQLPKQNMKGQLILKKKNNNKRPKTFDVDSTLSEPLMQSLNTLFLHDELPSEMGSP